MRPGSRRLRLGAVLHRWHRRLGAAAGLFLIWLAATGLLLNQTAAWQLDRVTIAWPWLMQWYGLRAEPPLAGWSAQGHWLATVDDDAVLDGMRLAPAVHAPLGLASAGGLLYVATVDSLVLLQPDGTRVDVLRSPPLPVASIRRIGTTGDRVVIQDLDIYASADGESWSPVAGQGVHWSLPQPLPPALRERMARLARPHLPLSRVLADAHSGRLFGRYGATVIDAVALMAVVLAASGLWLWLRSLRRQGLAAGHRHHR
jgi:uncharacterized iron-regulated membrane protein